MQPGGCVSCPFGMVAIIKETACQNLTIKSQILSIAETGAVFPRPTAFDSFTLNSTHSPYSQRLASGSEVSDGAEAGQVPA
jgi:hypothetical protein